MDFADDGYDAFASTSTQDRVPCHICGRKFNPDALTRHVPICQKQSQKKRKVFDTSKQRAEGTEINTVKKTEPKAAPRQQITAKKSNWRQKHEEFVNAIRGARKVQHALDNGLPLPPPPKPTINPDYVQCPHCERRFNETAAERHIKFCKEQHERLPKPKPNAAAVNKQNARLMYKPPKVKSHTTPSSLSVGNSRYGSPASSATSPTSPSGKPPTSRTGSGRSRHSRTESAGSRGHTVGNGSTRGQQESAPAGRVLRTGRTAESYSQARQLSASQRKRYPSNENIHKASYNSSRYSSGYSSPSSARNGESGYYSGTDDHHLQKQQPASGSRRVQSAAKFCHECGTKYPVASAKFCCECGVKRVNII